MAATLWVLAGPTGPLYAVLFGAVCAPGLPLGFALFGRGHAAGWIAGSVLGYATTTLAWWLVVVTGRASTPAFVAAWMAAGAATWLFARMTRRPLVALSRWTARDTAALLILLLMVPALVGRPFAKLGSTDASGNRLYRAYFIADFVWHTALTAELAKQEPRPVNPYLAPEQLHYYWTYFRVPATIVAQTGVDVQQALKLNAVAAALLFLASIYLAAWTAFPAWPAATAVAVALTVLGPSIEGLASIVDLLLRGQPLSELRNLNIDAVAAWAFKGLRIDDLPRAMWYTPQHAFSCALGLLAVPVALAGGLNARPAAVLLAGCALGASLAFNPLIGAAFCGVYAVAILVDFLRTRGAIQAIARHGLAVLPVALALGWATFNEVGEGAGAALHFGFWGPARNATILTFLLQFGPLLVPMVLGLWPGGSDRLTSVVPAVAGVTIAVLLMHLVTLTVDQAWMGFRGGQIFFVLAPAIVTRGLLRLWRQGRRRAALAVVAFVVVTGFPTSVIDAYNSQDVTNRGFAPRNEFHWTVIVPHAEQQALEWIRTTTPKDAVVQAEPTVRGRETWSLIPTFAERRMATGVAIPLLHTPEYDRRNARVREIYASGDAHAAWQDAKALGIDYLYVGVPERSAYPAVEKFELSPEYFVPVFKNAETAVYALRP